MTDEELCKVLRAVSPNPRFLAADRIEALTEQLEAARADAKEAEAYAEELAGDQVDLCRQLIAAEAKLAKVVEALREWDDLIKHQYSGSREAMSDMTYAAQHTAALLAEIEGEKG